MGWVTGGWGHMAGPWAWGMLLVWLLALLILATLAIGLLRSSQPTRPRFDSASARTILQERLARGEIDVDDFEQRSSLLEDE